MNDFIVENMQWILFNIRCIIQEFLSRLFQTCKVVIHIKFYGIFSFVVTDLISGYNIKYFMHVMVNISGTLWENI